MGSGTYTWIDTSETTSGTKLEEIRSWDLMSAYSSNIKNNIPFYSRIDEVILSVDAKQNLSLSSGGIEVFLASRKDQTTGSVVSVVPFDKNGVKNKYKTFKSGDIKQYFSSQESLAGCPDEMLGGIVPWYMVADCHAQVIRKYSLKNASLAYKFTYPTLTIKVEAIGEGDVSGGGTWDVTKSAQTKTITATPKTGYKFVRWMDNQGNTYETSSANISFSDNNYIIKGFSTTLTCTALFDPISYTITANKIGGGYVSGAGNHSYGKTATLTAVPDSGYRFVKWQEDNSTENPRSFTVTGDATYTAVFEVDKIYIIYDSLFSFKRWKDTNLASNSLISVSDVTDIGFKGTALVDDAYTNECRPLIPVQIGKEYTIEFDASGGGFECFVFNCDVNGAWESSNPMFTMQTNTKKFNFVSVTNYISIRCDVVGTGTVVNFSNFRIYPSDCPYMSNTLSAEERTDLNAWSMPTPIRKGYEFLGWYTQPNGGGTKYTSSSAFPTSDLVLYSHWKIQKHTATFKNHDGTVLQTVSVEYGGTPSYTGSTPTKPSTAEYSYSFSGWSPSIGAITSDTTYTAQFTATKQKYTINTSATNGGVSGGGIYEYGTSISLTASPADGYKFEKWSDGNTQNPRAITVTGNATYEAQFRRLVLKFKTVKIYYPSENNVASPTNPLVSGEKAQIVVQVALE